MRGCKPCWALPAEQGRCLPTATLIYKASAERVFVYPLSHPLTAFIRLHALLGAIEHSLNAQKNALLMVAALASYIHVSY